MTVCKECFFFMNHFYSIHSWPYFLLFPQALLLIQSTHSYLFKIRVSYFVATPCARHGEHSRGAPPFMGKTDSKQESGTLVSAVKMTHVVSWMRWMGMGGSGEPSLSR